MSNLILIVDDDPTQRRLLEAVANRQGYRTKAVPGGRPAMEHLRDPKAEPVDLVLLDLNMPDLDGWGVLEQMRPIHPSLPVVVLSAQAGVDTVVRAMRAGANDFVVKPVSPERLMVSIENALKIGTLAGQVARLSRKIAGQVGFTDMIAVSPPMNGILDLARRASTSSIPILIEGESGVGKELIARAIQGSSERKGKAFVVVNCGAIPDNLVESILFGHEKGAFTGAIDKHMGKFQEASGGTLFLDEIGEMPLEVQAKLLRVTQTREVLPLGAARPERVDVRIVCATHRDLHAMQRAGTFRGDLYARLNEIPVRLPPLRERKEDVFQLATAMLAREKRSDIRLGMPFLAGLLHYDFPFNVRELEAAVRAAAALAETDVLGEEHLPAAIRAALEGYGARPPGEREPQGEADTTRSPHDMPPIEVLVESLANHRGNLAAVGRDHGKSRATVHRWMKRYGLNPDDFRSGESNEE